MKKRKGKHASRYSYENICILPQLSFLLSPFSTVFRNYSSKVGQTTKKNENNWCCHVDKVKKKEEISFRIVKEFRATINFSCSAYHMINILILRKRKFSNFYSVRYFCALFITFSVRISFCVTFLCSLLHDFSLSCDQRFFFLISFRNETEKFFFYILLFTFEKMQTSFQPQRAEKV